jgi:hypothetical protein
MIYTVKIDDSTSVGKQLMHEIRTNKGIAKIIENNVCEPPAGYLTGDEFVKRGKEKIKQYYKDNGLL